MNPCVACVRRSAVSHISPQSRDHGLAALRQHPSTFFVGGEVVARTRSCKCIHREVARGRSTGQGATAPCPHRSSGSLACQLASMASGCCLCPPPCGPLFLARSRASPAMPPPCSQSTSDASGHINSVDKVSAKRQRRLQSQRARCRVAHAASASHRPGAGLRAPGSTARSETYARVL
jgi:hypothetical protein